MTNENRDNLLVGIAKDVAFIRKYIEQKQKEDEQYRRSLEKKVEQLLKSRYSANSRSLPVKSEHIGEYRRND